MTKPLIPKKIEAIQPDKVGDAKPKNASDWRRLIIPFVALVVISGVFVINSRSVERDLGRLWPELVAVPSTFNDKPTGYSALFELCKKMNITADRWQLPYRDLKNKGINGTLVIIDPREMPSDAEIKQILAWVKAGNDLVYLDSFAFHSGRRLIDALGIRASESRTTHEVDVSLAEKLPEAALLDHLTLNSDVRLDGADAVAEDDAGTLLCILYRGSGRILIGCVPEMCNNRRIADNKYLGNYQFLINWFLSGKHDVYFDERAQGYSAGENMLAFVAKSPLGYAILQLGIIFVVALVSAWQRFGAPEAAPFLRRISNLEFIDGMASTYARAHARETAWNMIFVPFKARLCKALSVSPHESLDKLAMSWSEQSGMPFARLQAFLERAHKAQEDKRLSKDELVYLVGECDKLTAESAVLPGTATATMPSLPRA